MGRWSAESRGRVRRGGAFGSAVAALAMVLLACGSEEPGTDAAPVAGEGPVASDDGPLDADAEEGGSLIPDEMRQQMEELAGDARDDARGHADDAVAPDVQAPASVTVSGDLEGSFDLLPRCDAFGDSVSIAFGGLRAPFDWVTEVPQIPGGVGVMIEFGGFSGPGTHGANLYLGSANEVIAIGEGDVALAFGELIEFPTYSLQVIMGTFEGDWSATGDFPDVGSGTVSGDIGVCSIPVE